MPTMSRASTSAHLILTIAFILLMPISGWSKGIKTASSYGDSFTPLDCAGYTMQTLGFATVTCEDASNGTAMQQDLIYDFSLTGSPLPQSISFGVNFPAGLPIDFGLVQCDNVISVSCTSSMNLSDSDIISPASVTMSPQDFTINVPSDLPPDIAVFFSFDSIPSTSPTIIELGSVPEPGSFALVTFSFVSGLGLAIRQKRKRAVAGRW